MIINILLVLYIGACSDYSPVSPRNNTNVTIGEIHTELLQELYKNIDTEKNIKGSLSSYEKNYIIINTVNQMTSKYNIESFSDEDILTIVEWGREMAQQDPVQIVSNILKPDQLEWWDRFSSEAEIKNIHQVYKKHCTLYGQPNHDSMLGQVLDTTLSSADFWDKYRGNQEPVYHNSYIPKNKSWRNVIRFCVTVVVDGAAGGLAGAGGSAIGGPVGGAVAGGIVGGLASHGADDILFN